MVRVDMNPARQAISKRHKRRRRIARHRLRKARRQQQQEFVAAEAARQARCAAVAKWTEEEKKREQQQQAVASPSPRKALVKFADDVLVTEIPVHDGDRLPKPVISPIGVSIADAPSLRFRDRVQTVKFVTINDDLSDYSDDGENDPDFVPKLLAEDDAFDAAPLLPKRVQPLRLSAKDVLRREHAHDESVAGATPPPENGDTSNNHYAQRASSNASASACPNKTTLIAIKSSLEKSEDSSKQLSSGGKPVASKESSKRAKPDQPLVSASSTSNLRPTSHEFSETLSESVSRGASILAHNATPPDNPKKKKRKLNYHTDVSPSSLPSSNAASPRKHNSSVNGHATAVPHASDPSLAREIGSPAKDATLSSKRDNDKEEIDSMFVDLVKLRASRKATDNFNLKAIDQRDEAIGNTKNGRTKKTVGGPTRYTEDGLRIVTYEELATDQPKGLNGPCPFDCSCCF